MGGGRLVSKIDGRWEVGLKNRWEVGGWPKNRWEVGLLNRLGCEVGPETGGSWEV